MNPTCPICGRTLEEGEELAAKYVEKHNWWALFHVLTEEKRYNKFPKEHVMNARCAQAGYQMIYATTNQSPSPAQPSPDSQGTEPAKPVPGQGQG